MIELKMKISLVNLLMAICSMGISSALDATNPDIDKIKNRVLTDLLKSPVDDDKVASLIQTLQEDGTWPGINYTDVSRTAFEHRYHSSNMVYLAQAYQQKSSKYYQHKKVARTVEAALQNWVEHDYFCDNWWHNQIGTPRNLVDLMLLMGDELPPELVAKSQPIIHRANIDAGGARPGGDRIKIASIQAKNALFLSDDKTFMQVVKIIEGEIKYVDWVGAKYGYSYRHIPSGFSNRSEAGRGIQYDNSFHHRTDGVNNTLSYGLGYADAFVEWAVYTNGTAFSYSEEKLQLLVDYYLDGICKTAIFGKYPDPGAKNRSISREHTLNPYQATTVEKLLTTTDYRKDELQEIADIRNHGIKPTTSHATYYWHSEHFSFQRPDFFTSVRLYSTRTHNMEQPYNSEGLLNHHRGDGTNHISRTGDEYYDIAPVFDYQKIPGTTVMQKAALPSEKEIQKLGLTEFVGAATDGIYGTVGFDFKSPHDPLCARKSWFFFDQEYVCLGAGISSREALPVVTTLNQCLFQGEVSVSTNNQIKQIPRGDQAYVNVDWVFHDSIGYVFPTPSTVGLKNGAATGSWYTINKQTDSPKGQVTLDVFKLWLDHGEAPSEATYQYIVVPASSIEQLQTEASKNNIGILSNTPELQAVQHHQLEMVQAVFYQAGQLVLSGDLSLSMDQPGILIIKMNDGKIKQITVADPNRELGKIGFSVSARLSSEDNHFSSYWNEQQRISRVLIDLPKGQYAGQSVTVICD
jgi:chondroitin AC lyase